jgi:hypothetical protein
MDSGAFSGRRLLGRRNISRIIGTSLHNQVLLTQSRFGILMTEKLRKLFVVILQKQRAKRTT